MSQKPTTGLNPGTHESSPHLHALFLSYSLSHPTSYTKATEMVFFLHRFRLKFSMYLPFSQACCILHAYCFYLTSTLKFGINFKLCSSSLRNFLYPLITSATKGPNNLLNYLFSNSLSLCPCRNVKHKVSYS
jgi:hypothetical protein